jgi:hypothetical protein
MSSSPTENFHSTHSSISSLSLQDPLQIKIVDIDQSPQRSASSPLLYRRNRPAILHQDRSSYLHPRLFFEDSESQPVLMNDWIRMKIDVPKIMCANMLASLFTWLLLAGFIVLPATFASIRNRALEDVGKTGKVVISTAQNIPLLWVAGTCCVCAASGLSWLWWGQSHNYIWLGDRIFL